MNVTLFKLIIQECNVENLSNEMILCLIRSGMVLTLTEIWKVFVQKRDFSGNIERQMEKTKRNTPAKTKVYISKKARTDGGKIKPRDHLNRHSRWALRKLKS